MLWERKSPPDDMNRILLNSNSLLVETDELVAVVEPGMGSKYDARQREIYDLEGSGVRSAIRELGRDPLEVDLLIPTHLHLDHAGGGTERDESGEARPTFGRAKVVVQRREWEAALHPHPLEAGSYRVEDFAPLTERLELVDGDSEIAPGITVQLTAGHTPGHQVVWIRSEGMEGVFAGDLVPTAAHLKLNWLMAWDLDPETLYDAKAGLLERCAREKTTVFLAHDPHVAACRVRREKPDLYAVDEASVFPAPVPEPRRGGFRPEE